MHSSPSKHGIHKISSLSGTYGNNLHVRLTLDFLVIFPYARHAVGNLHRGQTTAITERIITDARHAVGNLHRGQTTAIIERIIADTRHAVGNLHRGQTTAIIERIIADTCYGENYNSLEIISLPRFEW